MRFLLALLALAAAPAAAQSVQTPEEARAQDAGEYARLHHVEPEEAVRRLAAQEASVAATDRLREAYRKRLAGISIEHDPDYRIVVLLTGSKPVAEQRIEAGELSVPILFRIGAKASRAKLLKALDKRADEIRRAFPDARGLGLDPRRGELVMMLGGDRSPEELSDAAARLADIADVPARVRTIDAVETNFSVEGGARVEGRDTVTGRHAVCTAGFVVTDGAQTGLVTAAHCPDLLTYVAPGGARSELPFVGQWGWSFQDVQVNLADARAEPVFYVDRAKGVARAPAARRSRASTRAGDFVCHRGERSGYSCADVELTDYSPPGDLCGGPCAPVWVTVAGPTCGGGDSGGPVFSGEIAFGIMKGGTWGKGGRCVFYYYMSLDYLPDGWSLVTRAPVAPADAPPAEPPVQ